MTDGTDPALAWIDPSRAAGPATHVLIVGAGKYEYGKGPNASKVGGDLRQLSSPPVSARAIASWFIAQFRSEKKELGSVALLVSEAQPTVYTPPHAGAAPMTPPAATLANVKAAAIKWAERLGSHKDNRAVFYFCGHGISLGQSAALLLEDFGNPASYFDASVDLESFRERMKNSPAIEQLYLLDCCRTDADDLFKNQSRIGSPLVSLLHDDRGHADAPHPCVLFPTLDGEEAFGISEEVSAFTRCVIDAMSFAAADPSTGRWKTTTGRIADSVKELLGIRVPQLIKRSTPQALDMTSFDFNTIDEPQGSLSYVTVSDLSYWGQVELECAPTSGTAPAQTKHSKQATAETCCTFVLNDGRWRFSGRVPSSPPTIKTEERIVRAPVAYITLDVAR